MTAAQRFGEKMMILRRRAGLSQEDLAWRAELHRTEISALERGARLARIDTVIKLAGVLRVPPEQLLQGITWTPPRQVEGRLLVNPGGRGELGLGDG